MTRTRRGEGEIGGEIVGSTPWLLHEMFLPAGHRRQICRYGRHISILLYVQRAVMPQVSLLILVAVSLLVTLLATPQ